MPAKTQTPDDRPAETPHYHGHRERLRERFYNSGPDALSDYELLEMAELLEQIVDIATPLGIAVHDHIIVGKGGHASLKGMRLI
jgi:DNA repair protein RadC